MSKDTSSTDPTVTVIVPSDIPFCDCPSCQTNRRISKMETAIVKVLNWRTGAAVPGGLTPLLEDLEKSLGGK